MKKLFYLLLALPLIGFITACNDDDDDLPQVKTSLTYQNVTVSNGEAYVVKTDTLVVESVNVTAVRPGHKATAVAPVNYWVDGYPFGTSLIAPFGARIPTNDLAVGAHTITINMGVAEEGYPLATAVLSVKFNVVESADDIPAPSGSDSPVDAPVPHTFK